MASSTTIPLLLLILTISSTPLLHARDSQFFSKVTNTPTQTNTVFLPDKEVTSQETEPQQPDFIPQNQNEGHGLYGREDRLETTETKSGVQTRTPATYASERYYNSNYNYNSDKNRAETEQLGNREGETFSTNNREKYQNDDASFDFDDSKDQNDDSTFYNNNLNGVETEHYNTYTNHKDNGEKYYYSNKNQNDDASFYNYNGAGTEHYTTEESQKDNNNLGETETYYSDTDKNNQFGNQLRQTETNYNDNGYTNELNTRYNTYRPDTTKTQNRGGSNVVRQGMSDTRFMENGRYYYDLNEERLQNRYANQNSYKSNYDSQSGNREYHSNDVDQVNDNNYRFYDNSGGEKYEFNTMEEYEQSRQNHYDP